MKSFGRRLTGRQYMQRGMDRTGAEDATGRFPLCVKPLLGSNLILSRAQRAPNKLALASYRIRLSADGGDGRMRITLSLSLSEKRAIEPFCRQSSSQPETSTNRLLYLWTTLSLPPRDPKFAYVPFLLVHIGPYCAYPAMS